MAAQDRVGRWWES